MISKLKTFKKSRFTSHLRDIGDNEKFMQSNIYQYCFPELFKFLLMGITTIQPFNLRSKKLLPGFEVAYER